MFPWIKKFISFAGGAPWHHAGNREWGSSRGRCQSEEQCLQLPAFSRKVKKNMARCSKWCKTRAVFLVENMRTLCTHRPGARCCRHTHYSTLWMWSWSMKALSTSWRWRASLPTPTWSSWTTPPLRWTSIGSAMEVFCCLMTEAATLHTWKKRWTGKRRQSCGLKLS